MKYRIRATKVFQATKQYAVQSLRALASRIKISKSSIHRHQSKRKYRVAAVGHDFFESEVGQQFLHRLYWGVIFIFGIQASVGSDTLSLFFNAMTLATYLAVSPDCLRKQENKLRELITHYDKEQTAIVMNAIKDKPLHLGADETFFPGKLLLVLSDLPSGFIFNESSSNDRSYKSWLNQYKDVLGSGRYAASFTIDKGRALWKLAKEKSATAIVDLFHVLQDVGRVFAGGLASKLRSVTKGIEKIKQDHSLTCVDKANKISVMEEKKAILENGRKSYKKGIFDLSINTHPYNPLHQKKTSSVLKSELDQTLLSLRAAASRCELNDPQNLLDRCEGRLGALASINDAWHKWIDDEIKNVTHDSSEIKWLQERFLPWNYWCWQYKKSKRNPTFREHYNRYMQSAKLLLDNDPLTKKYMSKCWQKWADKMVRKYQRTSSAIEGRNGRLSFYYDAAKGLLKHHLASLTTIHNFWIKRNDGSTAAQRICDHQPPDLLEWLLERVTPVPVPRISKKSQQQLAA